MTESTPPGPSLHQRARHAIRLLVGRQAVLQVLALGVGVIVARILGPAPFGVFGIATFVIALAGLFTDLGARTVLIQQAEPVTEEQLVTCFSLQQAAVTLLVGLLFVTAPAIASLYETAPPELAWMIRLLAFDLYLRSWRSMSEITLERALRYRELAVSDIAGSVAFQTVAVGLVLSGRGVESLVVATLSGNAVRVAMLRRGGTWPVRLSFDGRALRRLLWRGMPLQASRVIGQAPGWVTPTLVASVIGLEAVGLLTWAFALGRKPLELLDNVVRVSLPHVARLQHDVAEVERVLMRYAVASLLACGLWFAVIAIAGRDLVELVYTARWLPAMLALVLYAGAAMIASVHALASTALVGIGRAHVTPRVSAVAAIVAIVTSVILVSRVGFVGVPLGHLAGILVATPWLLQALRPGAPARVLRGVLGGIVPLGVAMAAGALMLRLLLEAPGSVRGIAVATVICGVYLAAAWRVGPAWLRAAVREELALPTFRSRRPGIH
jgi:teichuronic acid exporter